MRRSRLDLRRRIEAATRGGRERPAWLLVPSILVLLSITASASLHGREHPTADAALETSLPDAIELTERARGAVELFNDVEGYYDSEVAPLQRVLEHYDAPENLARRIAVALVREGRRVDVDPRLLLAVMLVENPDLDTTATSSVGARGLMQIMPLHRGEWKACKGGFITVGTNICYGARIFAWNLRQSGGNVEQALLRYNGCVRGTNTPNCQLYPQHVYTRASRVNYYANAARGGRAAAP